MNRTYKNIFLCLVLALLMTSALLYLTHRAAPFDHQKQLDRDLIAAIHDENTAKVIGLLKQGANPDAHGSWDKSNGWGETWDRYFGKPRPANYGPTALMLAVFAGRIETVRALLENGANVNARNEAGSTALLYAGLYGRNEAALLLLDYGADANPNNYGDDPLLYFVEAGDTNLVRRLLARGAKINKQDASGNTPLLTASSLADAPIVRLLLEKGAEVNARDTSGYTALLRAVNAGSVGEHEEGLIVDPIHVSPSAQIETVHILLQKGANINARDKKGHTALQIARERSLSEIVGLLKTAGAKD